MNDVDYLLQKLKHTFKSLKKDLRLNTSVYVHYSPAIVINQPVVKYFDLTRSSQTEKTAHS